MWVARDKDGCLWLYNHKPKRREEYGVWDTKDEDIYEIVDSESWMFRSVKWSDPEPTEIKLVKKK